MPERFFTNVGAFGHMSRALDATALRWKKTKLTQNNSTPFSPPKLRCEAIPGQVGLVAAL